MPCHACPFEGCTADTAFPFPQGVHDRTVRFNQQLWFLFIQRVNLSPFTKDFRGGERYNESIDQFFEALPDRRVPIKRKITALLILLFALGDPETPACGRG